MHGMLIIIWQQERWWGNCDRDGIRC